MIETVFIAIGLVAAGSIALILLAAAIALILSIFE
jgi:hypothetical protein